MTVYIVYRTTNKITGHYYIGVHKQEVDDSYLGSGVNLRRQIRKYGKDSFLRETLFSYLSPVEAFQKEAELLVVHLGNSKCLNLVPGGEGGDRRTGAILTEETKEKLRAAAKKRHSNNPGGLWPLMVTKYGEDTARQMVRSGNKQAGGMANKGKKKSQEHKEKLSASLKAKPCRRCLICGLEGKGMPVHFGKIHKEHSLEWKNLSIAIES